MAAKQKQNELLKKDATLTSEKLKIEEQSKRNFQKVSKGWIWNEKLEKFHWNFP